VGHQIFDIIQKEDHGSESESVKSGEGAIELKNYQAEISMKEKRGETLRKKLTINPSSQFYQGWKIVGVALALSSSFEYAYYAAYLHRMSEEEIEFFYKKDTVYVIIFVLDTFIHIILNEHST
jgi:hypothetical protein